MPIKEITGNIIGLGETGQLDGWAHGCNCMHAMGSGIAGQVARRYPSVPQVDIQRSIRGDVTKIGSYTHAVCASIVDPGILFDVYNLYTQKTPSYNGEDVFEYDAFFHALTDLNTEITQSYTHPETYRLGIPKIGAGLAGGDWGRIQSIIYTAFDDSVVQVNIVDWDGSYLE